jgi:hypothetical protein
MSDTQIVIILFLAILPFLSSLRGQGGVWQFLSLIMGAIAVWAYFAIGFAGFLAIWIVACFDRTKATATLFKWKPLPPEALTMLAPPQTPDRFEGWLVNGEGYPKNTIVAVTKGRLDGRPVLTCTMAVVGVNGRDVERLFLDRLAPRKTGEQSSGMQEIRSYRLTTGVQEAEQLVAVSVAAPINAEPVVIISSMMDNPKR